MIDNTKRTTLKILAVTTGTVATTSVVQASALLGITAEDTNTDSAGQIEITTRLSAQTEELEIVFTKKLEAGETATIGLGHNSLNRNTALHHSAESLSYVVRNNVSVVAESNVFA